VYYFHILPFNGSAAFVRCNNLLAMVLS